MLLDSQFGMVHASRVYIPQHENIALQIKSQQLQEKLLLWSALIATHCFLLFWALHTWLLIAVWFLYCEYCWTASIYLKEFNSIIHNLKYIIPYLVALCWYFLNCTILPSKYFKLNKVLPYLICAMTQF